MKVVILSCLLAVVLGVDYDAFKRGFDSLDLKDDGNITIEETTATQLPGTLELIIQGNFSYYDNKNGPGKGMISLSIVPVLFEVFDADGDGEITVKECFIILPQIIDGIEIMALDAA